jgi:hypothetical protein
MNGPIPCRWVFYLWLECGHFARFETKHPTKGIPAAGIRCKSCEYGAKLKRETDEFERRWKRFEKRYGGQS